MPSASTLWSASGVASWFFKGEPRVGRHAHSARGLRRFGQVPSGETRTPTASQGGLTLLI